MGAVANDRAGGERTQLARPFNSALPRDGQITPPIAQTMTASILAGATGTMEPGRRGRLLMRAGLRLVGGERRCRTGADPDVAGCGAEPPAAH